MVVDAGHIERQVPGADVLTRSRPRDCLSLQTLMTVWFEDMNSIVKPNDPM